MERIDVFPHVFWKQIYVNQLSAVGCNRKILPAVVIGVLIVLLAQNYVLDSDTEFTVLVVSRLIGNAHSFNKLGPVSSTDTLGTFVHV